MALSTARAAALTVAGCALAAAAWLPPEPTEPMRPRMAWHIPAQRVRWELRRADRERALAVETLVLLERRDSLVEALPATPAGALAVAAPDVPPAWNTWVTDHAQNTRGSGPVLAAVFMDTTGVRTRPVDRRRWDSWSNSTTIAFGTAADPFSCVAFHDIRRTTGIAGGRTLANPDRFPTRTALSVCRFFAAYGPPGPHVRGWLLDGGWQFGSTTGTTRPGAFAEGHRTADVFPHLVADEQYTLAACIAGSADGCRRWWLEAPLVPRPGWVPYWRAQVPLDVPAAFVDGWWGDLFGGLLEDLSSEMGDERFRAFWTSPAPVDSAFASAFGVNVGTWTRDWLERRFGPLPRRGPHGGDYAAAVVFTGLLAAFAAAAGRRRQVR